MKHVNIRNFKNLYQTFETSIIQIKEAQGLKSVWLFRVYISMPLTLSQAYIYLDCRHLPNY